MNITKFGKFGKDAKLIKSDALLTSAEVGRLLQVNASSVKNWVADGRIQAFRTPGGHRRIRADEVARFLRAHDMPIPDVLAFAMKRRMMVVDDDEPQLRALGRLLASHRDVLELCLCDNGIDALIQVGTFRPHLVVLDAIMPDVDGIEVCRRLKANPKTRDITIVLASGHLTKPLRARAQEVGVELCMEKPFNVGALLGALGVEAER